MKCPNCEFENSDASKFCLKCGTKLVGEQTQRPIPPPPVPVDPLSQAAKIAGPLSIIGGAMLIIGWLLPWFGLGESSLLGYVAGLPSFGTGAQITLLLLFGGVIAVGGGAIGSVNSLAQIAGASSTPPQLAGALAGGGALVVLLGIICLCIGVLLISIPILAAILIRSGFQVFGIRSAEEQPDAGIRYGIISEAIIKARSRAKYILILMLILMAPVIIFLGLNMLGSGFIIALIGSIILLLVPYFADPHLRKFKQ